MLASSARVVPATAVAKREWERGFTWIRFSSFASSTSWLSSIDNEPFLPLSVTVVPFRPNSTPSGRTTGFFATLDMRSEEHTSELQSRENLVCRLLLEKKKKKHKSY